MTTYSQHRYTLGKEEKLCSQKSIDRLFAEGKSFIAYPLRIVYYAETEEVEDKQLAKLLISVPKRKFKRANKRNRIKRLVREAYRLGKHELIACLREEKISVDLSLIYLNDELPNYETIEKAINKAISVLKGKVKERGKDEKAID